MNYHYRMVTKYLLSMLFVVTLQGCDDSISLQGSETMAIEKPGCYPLRFIIQTSSMESASMIALEKGRAPTAINDETDCRDTKTQSGVYGGKVNPGNNDSFHIDTQRWFPTSGCYLISMEMRLLDDVGPSSSLKLSVKTEELSLGAKIMAFKDGQPISLTECYKLKS